MARPERKSGNRDLRLLAYVALGVLLGISYVVFDSVSETRLGRGTLTGPLADAHAIVDRVVPILIGALLGVCAHYFRLRARLSVAEEAAHRAEALRLRLQKVERDQAVWVLAAAVLHELNNPLQALGLLLDELSATDDETTRHDLVGRAQGQASRALSHLRTLRSMRTLGEPEAEHIALDGVLRALADDVEPLAAEDGFAVRVDCTEPVHASADPHYVRIIVENLLDNSLQALRAGGGHCITLRAEAEGARAIVLVSDDGPALDPSGSETLFEPLRSTKRHGLGLGLPIARALARAMRGDVRLDESKTKTFRLELPLVGDT
jgi:signal transduction histidine kinase